MSTTALLTTMMGRWATGSSIRQMRSAKTLMAMQIMIIADPSRCGQAFHVTGQKTPIVAGGMTPQCEGNVGHGHPVN